MKRFGLLLAIALTFSCTSAQALYPPKKVIHTKPKKPVLHRDLLIIGCARGGTTYMGRLLGLCGLKIGHEHIGEDGCVAWQGVFDVHYSDWWPRFPENRIKFKHIFHQIRNPLGVIGSYYDKTIHDHPGKRWWRHSWVYVCDCVPEININEPLLVRCAKYWYYWNLAAEKRASWTYRIEDIEKALPEMSARLGIYLNPANIGRVPKNTNTSHRKTFVATWAMLEKELDPTLLANIKALAKRYGYRTHD